ncbi:alpha/beta fold hydrolase [Phytoactinopolyspora halotolerans]|uniref:Alpha/beta fold hydrolase n=1 Tax=Phytoactinopolyspora halotolerans TaxID=1981512 RepID=A0A6L9S5R9_9ACTN|nr:alpha/beta fold hydrolase [Phytoactinopolyspora halotolerans]NEE00439.1 alpha/beta fold hydrolase [Phytoactinopolyspora halotolerans]
MSAVVLVHGAWHGGWCWGRLRPLLEAAGHRVYTPTLTGLSDRAHLLSPSVGLDTHVTDVVRLIDAEGCGPVTLVGHSYAGQVVTAVADARPDLVARRVYLDAFIGEDGQAAIDLLPEQVADHYRESVAGPGFGWLIPPRSLSVLGVTDDADLAWLTPRLTPHPWLTYTQPLRLSGAVDDVPAAYVDCVDWMQVFAPYAERARSAGWPVHTLHTGHEAMVTAPKELAEALLAILSA